MNFWCPPSSSRLQICQHRPSWKDQKWYFWQFSTYSRLNRKKFGSQKVAPLHSGHFAPSPRLLGLKMASRLQKEPNLLKLCFPAPVDPRPRLCSKNWLVTLTTFVPVYYKLKKQIRSVPLVLQDAILPKYTTLKRLKMVFLTIFEFF